MMKIIRRKSKITVMISLDFFKKSVRILEMEFQVYLDRTKMNKLLKI